MRVTDFMDPKGILLHANIHTMQDTVGILVELQEGLGGITNGTACYNAACKRETMGGTTAIGQGIALPHTANAGVCAPGAALPLTVQRSLTRPAMKALTRWSPRWWSCARAR